MDLVAHNGEAQRHVAALRRRVADAARDHQAYERRRRLQQNRFEMFLTARAANLREGARHAQRLNDARADLAEAVENAARAQSLENGFWTPGEASS